MPRTMKESMHWPKEPSDMNILKGPLYAEKIPPPEARCVKVFLASTVTDMFYEKEALVNRVYPKLREYTREKYGLEFQVIDLRWGMGSELLDYNEDQTLGIQILQECLDSSKGVNFVALVGQKYGHRTLPYRIPGDDYKTMTDALNNHKSRATRDSWLLDVWYREDENAHPSSYVLLSPEYVPEGYLTDVYGERSWESISEAIWVLLDKAVKYAIQDGEFDESAVERYLMSDLEKEMKKCLETTYSKEDNSNQKALVFMRNIEDLKNYVSHDRAAEFMDLEYDEINGKLEWSETGRKHIEHLSQTLIQKWLNGDSVTKFTKLWRYDVIPNCAIHDAYIDDFCKKFETAMKQKIDDTCENHHVITAEQTIQEEVTSHWQRCGYYCREFVGRDDIIDFMYDYVISDSLRPLVLYGDVGVGKSSLIAKAASRVPYWLNHGKSWTILRFIGHTSASQDAHQLLTSVYKQLQDLMHGSCEAIPSDFNELATAVSSTLARVPDDITVVMMLDGLDLLVPQFKAHSMAWLPRDLKENVKIIVTVVPEKFGILSCLRTDVVQDESLIVHVGGMTGDDTSEMLSMMLEKEDRRLSHEHWFFVAKCLAACGYPLYIKLLFEIVKTMKSFDDGQIIASVPGTIDDIMSTLLASLEEKHGEMVTSHALAYITASRTGLSDCEMEDVLSLDDDVMSSLYPGKETPTRRVPSIVWFCLKRNIWNLLSTRTSEGMTTYYWSHQKFAEACRNRYLSTTAQKQTIHRVLADYFLGLWANKRKDYTVKVIENGTEVTQVYSADRLVISQPLTFGKSGNCVYYNRRKYDQVPAHLYFSGRFTEFSDHILFNYDWLYNKTKALTLDYVLDDFLLNPGVEALLVERALRDAHPYIRENKDSLATELTGRLLPYYENNTNIRSLIDQCDRNGVKHCGIVPTIAYHCIPGSPLKYTLECSVMPDSLTLVGPKSRCILVKQSSKATIHPYDLSTGEHLPDVIASAGEVHSTPNGKYLVVVDHVGQNSIKIHERTTGKFLGQLIPMKHLQVKPKEKYSLTALSLSNTLLCLLITTDISYLCIANIQQCRFLHIQGLDGKADICSVTPDSKYVYTNAGREVVIYDLQTSFEKLSKTKLDYAPVHVIFNKKSTRAFIINKQENKVYVIHSRKGTVEMVYKMVLTEAFPDDLVQEIVLSGNETYLLARGNYNILVYNLYSEKIICHFPKPKGLPDEFKMPNSSYVDIQYTQAKFTPDDKFVVATIFRNIYIWSVVDSRLLTTLQAPIGIIERLLVPDDRGQIVTYLQGSKEVHVWSLGDSIAHVAMHDKMTKRIAEIQITVDSKMAFLRCEDSDEVGVVDTSNGDLADLLTHPGVVTGMAVTPDGGYAFVGTESKKANTANKIWNVKERKVIYEFGNKPCYGVAMKHQNSIACVSRTGLGLNAPYEVKLFQMHGNGFDAYPVNQEVFYVNTKPFITLQDKFLIIFGAQGFDDKNVLPTDPTVFAVRMKSLTVSEFRTSDLSANVCMTRMLSVKPSPSNPFSVIIIYTSEPDLTEEGKTRIYGYDHCFGFLILDINSGVVCQVIERFLTPTTPLNAIIFSPGIKFCVDNQSNVFDMEKGYYVQTLQENERADQPRCLVLDGSIVVYYRDSYLYTQRVDNKSYIGRVNVHSDITALAASSDDRTLMVGCADGSFVAFLVIDNGTEDPASLITALASRQLLEPTPTPSSCGAGGRGSSSTSRISSASTWDLVDRDKGRPPYSRPPSAAVLGPSDKELLKSVRKITPDKPVEETMLFMSKRSTTCCVQ